TSMCDNGLSQSWFRKLLKLLARRDDDGHKFQSRSFPQCDLFSVSYLDILKLDRADLGEVLPANVFADSWRSDSGRLRAARRWVPVEQIDDVIAVGCAIGDDVIEH